MIPIPQSSRYIIPDMPSADELLPFLRQIDENRWYSNFGPLALEFEVKFAEAMRKAHASAAQPVHVVTLSTCYHALAIGLKLLGVNPGDKVLVPAITFPACPLAVQHIEAEPLLADVDVDCLTITPDAARKAAESTSIKAVMPVAVYGIPVPADEWDRFTEDTGIPVIIDAAAAIESQLYLKKGIVAHSMHALKPFGIGEGGLLVSSDEKLISAAREYSNFGTRERITYTSGENAKLSEYHAAVALAQLERWPAIKARRKQIYEIYKTALSNYGLKEALLPGLDQAIVSSLMLRLPKGDSVTVMKELNKRGVMAHRTYLPPLYQHPHFANLTLVGSNNNAMPGCEELNRSIIGIPFHAFMTEEEIDNAVRSLKDLL
ncbi:MAG: aminotransferase class I/II-fold pyridoxal phosphate-dependent enzyme [Alphaproteobacteria bacterium]|nr:aminotransferase class I/II-fold pyridoxal phosphate-dependent enzyme [Alphaproteobacteria bacterium]